MPLRYLYLNFESIKILVLLSKYKLNAIETKSFFKNKEPLFTSQKNERTIVLILCWKTATEVCMSHFLIEGQITFSNKIKIYQFMQTFYFKLILRQQPSVCSQF